MTGDPYLILKWVHILSSTVLFGTGIGTAFQMVFAMRTDKVETVHSVASGVVKADWIFTLPSGIIQPLSGIALVLVLGYDLTAPWLVMTYLLYLLAFACWLPVVRLQIRIRDLSAQALAEGTDLPQAARRAYSTWFWLGWPAFGALIVIFWLMVARPGLW